MASLPRIGVALGVLAFFVIGGKLLRLVVRARLTRTRTPSFTRVFARLTSTAATLTGVLLAATIVFPSVRPVDVLSGAGVLTIAAGFAFQDILQNLLAGILLLFRQPFRGGDQIKIGDMIGTVEEINIRETVLATFDGRRILIPNAKVYTGEIQVQTAHRHSRSSFTVGVAYETDLATARMVAVEAVGGVEGVLAEPAPEALYLAFGRSAIDLDVRFWCDAREPEMRRTMGRAMEAVKAAFDAHGVEMPGEVVALRGTTSLATALRGEAVPAGGSVGDGQAAPNGDPVPTVTARPRPP